MDREKCIQNFSSKTQREEATWGGGGDKDTWNGTIKIECFNCGVRM